MVRAEPGQVGTYMVSSLKKLENGPVYMMTSQARPAILGTFSALVSNHRHDNRPSRQVTL